MGFDPDCFCGVITSGEVTHRHLSARPDAWWAALGRRCLHFTWAARGAISLEGLGLEVTADPQEVSAWCQICQAWCPAEPRSCQIGELPPWLPRNPVPTLVPTLPHHVQADFILAHGTEALGASTDGSAAEPCSLEQMSVLLDRCTASGRRLPMVVANPDVVTVSGSELRWAGQGGIRQEPRQGVGGHGRCPTRLVAAKPVAASAA